MVAMNIINWNCFINLIFGANKHNLFMYWPIMWTKPWQWSMLRQLIIMNYLRTFRKYNFSSCIDELWLLLFYTYLIFYLLFVDINIYYLNQILSTRWRHVNWVYTKYVYILYIWYILYIYIWYIYTLWFWK